MQRRSFVRLLGGSTLSYVVSRGAIADIGFPAERLAESRPNREGVKADRPVVNVVGIESARNKSVEQIMLGGLTKISSWISIATDAMVIARSHTNFKFCFEDRPWLGSSHNLAGLLARIEHGLSNHERAAIADALADTDAVCLMAGLDGGTATRSAPQVATVTGEGGPLTAAVVTTPFTVEGRNRIARTGLARILRTPDTVVSLSNDTGLWFLPCGSTVLDADDRSNLYIIDYVMTQIDRLVCDPVTNSHMDPKPTLTV